MRPAAEFSILHLDQVEVVPAVGAGQFLRLAGWIEGALVDELLVEIDGEQQGALHVDLPRPDVAEHLGETLVRGRGFETQVAVRAEPGPHHVGLRAAVDGRVLWQAELAFPPGGLRCRIYSRDLERLERAGGEAEFVGAVSLNGRVDSDLDVEATLLVHGEPVVRTPLDDRGAFHLRYVPPRPGEHQIQVRIASGGRVLHDSGRVQGRVRPMRVPADAIAAVEGFLRRFGLEEAALHHCGTEELTARLLERDPRRVDDLLAMLAGVGVALRTERPGSGLVTLPDALPPAAEPLRVLFASWEVPCRRHGGGVAMFNLIRTLSERHSITVVHPFGSFERRWSDELRPFVTELIAVPRSYQRSERSGCGGIPEQYHSNFSPELAAAIDAELASGAYDLVNFEKSVMYAHLPAAGVPRVLTIQELNYKARLNSDFATIGSAGELAEKLLAAVQMFCFEAAVLPAACPDLITVSEEDGNALARFQAGGRVYVNTIGADCDGLAPPAESERGPAEPTLVFLGNFQHTPNVKAVEFVVSRVLPAVTRDFPACRFRVLGHFADEELSDLLHSEHVEVQGSVDDFRPDLWRATAFVAPLFTGAGMRVKVLEAMACGAAVIGTGLSMEGIGGVPDEHYLRAETADELAAAALALLRDPQRARALGRRGRQLIVARHDRRRAAEERERIWRTVISRHAVGGPAPSAGAGSSAAR